MSQSSELKRLISIYFRRLQKLKEKEALQGVSVDPSIIIEIEDLESKLEQLQAQLQDAGSTPGLKADKKFFVGNQLRELREELGLSTSEIVDLINLHSEKLYLQLEANEVECSEAILLKVSEATNVKLEWLKHGGWRKLGVEFLDWRRNPGDSVEQIAQLSPHAVYLTIVNAATDGSLFPWPELKDFYYEGKGEHLHAGICVGLDEFRYKIYDLMTCLDFWNQPREWTVSEFYIFTTKLLDQFFHNLHSVVITDYIDDRILYSGQVHPKRIFEQYWYSGQGWAHCLVNLEASDSKQYGNWFKKVQREFRKYR